MKTLILRHRRENLKKCSLRGLEGHPLLEFFTYPIDPLPKVPGLLLLKVGAPLLTKEDQNAPILLLDGTWRLAEKMEKSLGSSAFETRSLPSMSTVYPRKQTLCPDPKTGLASVEALYLTHLILGRSVEGLLDHYFWKDQFLTRLSESVFV